MPITRTLVKNPEGDFDPPAYKVADTNAAERYVTQEGDYLVYMNGGNDTVRVDKAWDDGSNFYIRTHGGAGNDRILDGWYYSSGGAGNDHIETHHGDQSSFAEGGAGNDVLVALGGGGDGDYLSGGDGRDVLRSRNSPDRHEDIAWMDGGRGVDRFKLTQLTDDIVHLDNINETGVGRGKRDVIVGFEIDDQYGDQIDISDLAPAGGWHWPSQPVRNPGRNEVSYYFDDGDTILVGNREGKKFEVELRDIEVNLEPYSDVTLSRPVVTATDNIFA